MSEIREIVNSLENKCQKLFLKIENLQQENQELLVKLSKYEKVVNNQTQEITSIKSNLDSLRITNSLLGSDEYKRDTKLKINSLIREIDYCIAQLSD